MSQVNRELRKAFDHAGLDGILREENSRRIRTNDCRFSFWVKDTYTFQRPATDNHWRRVEDESPKDGDEVLVWPRDRNHVTAIYDADCGYVLMGGAGPPTHWMPLPRPPSAASATAG